MNDSGCIFCKISITLVAKVALWAANKGHKHKKWLISSIPWLQRHISEGVSMKLWHFLWNIKQLKTTLYWRRYRSPKGVMYTKNVFFFGRIMDKIWSLRIFIDGILSKWVITVRNNCIWEETIHVSRRATSYSMKGIIIILTVQRSLTNFGQ